MTLTSYPPRFPTLALTLKSLLAQSLRPDRLYLWIAECDLTSLPADVTRLAAEGLVIRSCANLRSYKKIIPALACGDDDYLVIADDDVYYPRHWLREIVAAHSPHSKEVICTRAHVIRLDNGGMPRPYAQWRKETPAGQASQLLVPTGIGGVLYEPGIFHSDVTRADIFLDLCPTTDDIWLYWMAALNGARFRKIGRRTRLINWIHTQRVGLVVNNDATGNDEQVAKMIARYGFPFAHRQQKRSVARAPHLNS